MTVCKNCNYSFKGKFCSNCGQAAQTHRLSFHYIWHDLQHGLFHFDSGIFFTTKELLTRPGHAIREFINGKRVRHTKPLTFVVVLATLYGLLYHYFIHNLFDVQPIHATENVVTAFEKVIQWNLDHLAYTVLILIVTTTVASYQVLKKQGCNLAEHLVLNTYYRGLELVIAVVLFPVLYILYKNNSEALRTYALLFQLLDLVLMYWCYAQFFGGLTKIQALGRTLLTYSFMSIINMTIGYVGGWIASVV